MSKTIAIRVSDDAHSALAAHCQAKGLTMTELLTPILLGLIDLPPTPASPLELRVMELETLTALQQTKLDSLTRCLDGAAIQLVECFERLDVLEDDSEHLEHCFDQDTPDPKPEAIDLKATENLAAPEQIGVKISPVSSRVSDMGCNGTSDEPLSNPDIEQAIIAVLKPYPKGGYYFRSEYLGQTKILKAYRDQATQMGFVPKDLYVEGGRLTGWLNKDYCLTDVNTQSEGRG